MRLREFLVIFLIISIQYLAQSVSSPDNESAELISEQDLFLEDFKLITDKILDIHPGIPNSPFPLMGNDEFEEFVNLTKEKISKIKSKNDFYYEIKRFSALLNDGHTDIWNRSKENWTLPVSFNWFENDLFITEVEDDKLDSILFAKIIKVGNLSIQEFKQKTFAFFSSDKDNIGFKKVKSTYGYTEKSLYQYFDLLENEKISIRYIKNGNQKSVDLEFTKSSKIKFSPTCRNDITNLKNGNTCYIDTNYKLTYLQINRLPNDDSKIDSFYNDAFRLSEENSSKYLIIDLRDNMGGSSSWARKIVPYILDESKEINYVNGWKRNGKVNVSLSSDPDYIKVKHEYKFNGKVFVLTSSKTFSSATWFVIAIKDNNLGKIIGTRCGNNSIRYGFSTGLELPNSKYYFNTSKRIWARSKSGVLEYEQFIEPDNVIKTTINDYMNNIDPYWDYIIKNEIN